MTKTIVVAFLARAGSGKTTAARHLVDNHGAVRVSFAAPLKEMAGKLFQLNDDQLYGCLKERPDDRQIGGATPRELMQLLGNCAREHIGKEVWVDAAMNTIQKNTGRLIVIDDCRYPNEAEFISNLYRVEGMSGHVVKIISPDRTSVADPHHPSEAGVDLVPDHHLFDTVINDQHKGLDRFRGQITQMMADVLGIFPGRFRD